MCVYQKKEPDKGRFFCSLGWYGGRPWIGNCIECLKRKDNTPEAKAAFDASSERAHPSNHKRISGCCDRADQY
jgi:hypothetical protein